MENNTTTITGKTWKAGPSTLVLTITKPAIATLQIKAGDIIQATLTKTANAEEKIKNRTNKAAEEIMESIPEINAYKPKVALRK